MPWAIQHALNVAALRFCLFSLFHFLVVTLQRNYKLLGVMFDENKHLLHEATHYRSLRGFIDNDKRLDYSKNPRVLSDVRTCLLSCHLH